MLNNVVYLLLRRLRAPLVALILVYAVSVLGLVLIPGMDPQGRPYHMDFFHAFYFVSFMGSTIGFGEIPYPFTPAQRLWTTLSMYFTVTAWLYGIGALLSNLQDPALRAVFNRSRFVRAVRRIKDPYYLVCGYGDTGALVVRELAAHGIPSVVIDTDQDRINALELDETAMAIPGLAGDPTDSTILRDAGIERESCKGLIAVTGSDAANLQIALDGRLLKPEIPVIARADTWDTQINMESFGTNHVINPFEAFARRFALMFHSPSMYLVDEWMTSLSGTPLTEFVAPPRGRWILCGYGRFGKALEKHLAIEGVETQIIEADPSLTQPPPDTIIGRGTEADTLLEAGVDEAAGLIAGTDNDANNLSIIVTAVHLRPGLFTVGRQTLHKNSAIFDAARVDIVMQPSRIMARGILTNILAPLLGQFRRLARQQSEEWANILVSRVSGVISDQAPETWDLRIRVAACPGLATLLEEGATVTIEHILTNPHNRGQRLPCLPLLLKRGTEVRLLPAHEEALQLGDELLFCGLESAHFEMLGNVRNLNLLHYIITGIDRPAGVIWRWLSNRRAGALT